MRTRPVLAAATLLVAGCGGQSANVVHADGRIGPFGPHSTYYDGLC
jgi:hypothetical protein